MDDNQVLALFKPLWDDIDEADAFQKKQPLLAHYTSISALESILKNDEIWFSNPLLMNDIEELRFGILQGVERFRYHDGLRDACHRQERFRMLLGAFDAYFDEFDLKHAFDTCILLF